MRGAALRRALPAAAAILALLAIPAAAAPGQGSGPSGEQSWTGWITDERCGAANANADGKSCALSCYKGGARLVLYVEGDDRLYHLDRQEEASRHVGHQVRVTGREKDGRIKVIRIEKSAAS